jgi:hypothetical protein
VPGHRNQDLQICSQELWPLDHRGGRKRHTMHKILFITCSFLRSVQANVTFSFLGPDRKLSSIRMKRSASRLKIYVQQWPKQIEPHSHAEQQKKKGLLLYLALIIGYKGQIQEYLILVIGYQNWGRRIALGIATGFRLDHREVGLWLPVQSTSMQTLEQETKSHKEVAHKYFCNL